MGSATGAAMATATRERTTMKNRIFKRVQIALTVQTGFELRCASAVLDSESELKMTSRTQGPFYRRSSARK
jgi:hypothetical protein